MRADRLVSLVLLLRHRGRMSASALARELEVSTRTVLRDIEALSTAGVPVYAERGRHGGFALLPGFRTELTGLTQEETVAVLIAGAGRGERLLGLGPALAAGVRKVVDALPDGRRSHANELAQRLLIEPETDLLSRRAPSEPIAPGVLAQVRRAVLDGHRLQILYAAADKAARWRTVDPIGLVTVRDRTYLLATHVGADRTYRLSRVREAELLDQPADRPSSVDLERLWEQRRAQFLAEGHLVVDVRVDPARREELLSSALALRAEEPDGDGWLRLEVTFHDAWHAEWALWRLGTDAEAVAPESLRAALGRRATVLAELYARA